MMKCLSLCLVLIYAVAVNSYPNQRVTLVGIPQSEQFFRDAFNPFHSPNAREVEDSGEPTDGVINFETPGSSGYDDGDSSDVYPRNFADIMRAMQEAVIRLRQEMNAVLNRLPEHDDKGLGDVFSHPDDKGLGDVFSLGSDFGSDVDLSDVKNKSTSETKLVDGQLVTVNETVIRSGDDHGGSIFRVKTIQVRPTDSTPSDSTPDSDSTPVPEIAEVETQRSKNDDSNDIPHHIDEPQMRYTEWDSQENENDAPSNHLNDIETFYDIEMMEPTNISPVNYDLSKDTRVNDYLSEKAKSQGLVMINPDAEFIDVDQLNPKENEYYRYESHPVVVNEEKL